MIKFKIIEINPDEHSIVVRFYTEVLKEEDLALQLSDTGQVLRGRTDYSIDLPVPAPTGEELKAFIMARAPVTWLQKQEAVADANIDTSLSTLSGLLGVEMAAALVPPEVPASKRFVALTLASVRT